MKETGLKSRHFDSQFRTIHALFQVTELKIYALRGSSLHAKESKLILWLDMKECVWACLGSGHSLQVQANPYFP